MALADAHLVGRADELGALDHALDELDQLLGRDRARRGARSGRPGLSGNWRGWRRRAGTSSSPVRRRSSNRICRSPSSSMRWTSTSTLEPAFSNPGRRRPNRARARLPLCPPSPVGEVAPSTSGTAATVPFDSYRALAATKPLVLVLDDFHWADAGSVELLGALLRRPPATAVLISVAHRPCPMPEHSAALERAHRSSQVTRVEVGAMTRDEARELLGEEVDVAASTKRAAATLLPRAAHPADDSAGESS